MKLHNNIAYMVGMPLTLPAQRTQDEQWLPNGLNVQDEIQ